MATTKENVRAKVIELLNDIRSHLESRLDSLLNSKAIDFENENDNWGLPKDIIQALAKEMAFQYSNIHPSKEEIKRVVKFTAIIRFPELYRNVSD